MDPVVAPAAVVDSATLRSGSASPGGFLEDRQLNKSSAMTATVAQRVECSNIDYVKRFNETTDSDHFG
ncbi:hypothetical protein JYT28_01305 [Desulfobulbus sp. AH-315-M07]|nr:hypothetical protein [Desulfobulbus sp. AH-315-M07]